MADANTTDTTTNPIPPPPRPPPGILEPIDQPKGQLWRMYMDRPQEIPAAMSELLQSYSGIPPSSQEEHIIKVRDRAYAAVPYPCLGRFRFLQLDLSRHPLYQSHVIPTMTAAASPTTSSPAHDPIFLDVGVCLGQDLRKLIFDGVPVSRVYGADVYWKIVEPGYDLFGDEAKLPRDRFLVPGNMLDESDANALNVMFGKCDMVNFNAVFHLFDLKDQVKVAGRAVALLRRDTKVRKLVLGQNLAKFVAEEEENRTGKMRYRHDEKTWREMWEGVFATKDLKEVVKAWEIKDHMVDMPQYRSLYRWHVWWVWVEFK